MPNRNRKSFKHLGWKITRREPGKRTTTRYAPLPQARSAHPPAAATADATDSNEDAPLPIELDGAATFDEDQFEMNPGPSDEWQIRQERQHHAWKAIRLQIVHALAENLSAAIYSDDLCPCGQPATSRCSECSIGRHQGIFCSACAEQHSRQMFAHHPKASIVHERNRRTTFSETLQIVAYHVDGYGVREVPFESTAASLLAFGLFPGSPVNPKVAFTVELLRYARFLVLSANMSMQKTLEACSFFWNDPSAAMEVLPQFRTALVEYMRAIYQLEHSFLEAEGRCRTDCPSCANSSFQRVTPHIRIADGYFSASHRIRGGRSYGEAAVAQTYFSSADHSINIGYEEVCKTRFRAAMQLSSSDRRFDITGIFGSVCTHGFIDEVFDMDKGEKYCYSIAMLSNLKERHPEGKVALFYDIGCHLAKHLQRRWPLLVPYITSLPILHSYCHGYDCQVQFSPNSKYGIGNTDGENMERVWSSLSDFVGRTQNMTLERRQDLLAMKFDFMNQDAKEGLFINLESALNQVLKEIIRVAVDPRPYAEIINDSQQDLEESAESASYRMLCKQAQAIRALDGNRRIGTSLASKIKRQRIKAVGSLKDSVHLHNQLYNAEVTIEDIFDAPVESKKSSYWVAIERFLYLSDDIRSLAAASEKTLGDITRYLSTLDNEGERAYWQCRLRIAAMQCDKSVRLKNELLAQTERLGVPQIDVEQVRLAFQQGRHKPESIDDQRDNNNP